MNYVFAMYALFVQPSSLKILVIIQILTSLVFQAGISDEINSRLFN